MGRLPALERLVFVCLWSMADDEGRIEGDALAVWRFGSFREDSRALASALKALESASRVLLYEVEGNPFIQIVNFTKHQRIDHPSKSKFPAYTNGCDLLQEASRGIRESSRILAPDQEQGTGSREQGSVKTIAPSASHSEPPLRPPKVKKANGHEPDTSAVIERIPLNDGTEFEVRESFVAELDRLYPAVESKQTLREIRGWCIGNPGKRKTARGVTAFLTRWFGKEQDKYSGGVN